MFVIICLIGWFMGCHGTASRTTQGSADVSHNATNVTDQVAILTNRLDEIEAKGNADMVNTNNMFGLVMNKLEEMEQKFSGLIQEERIKLQDVTVAMDSRISQLNEDVKHMKFGGLGKDMFSLQSPFISFTAYATETRDYNKGDTVLFDGIIRNYSALYNPETSVFTCEYTGYYYFAINILSDPGFVMAGRIMLDGTELARAFADLVSTGVYVQANNMVVTLCEQGSQVYVECPHDGNRLHGHVNYLHSTFVGTLLQHLVP